MISRDTALLRQMDDYILDGKYRDATDAYCRLVAANPAGAAAITTHVIATAAPYLHVPSHQKLLPNGEFRNVNYDHTILGIRAGMRLMPWLSDREKYLTLAQAMYYVPQGLDVWAQLECGFPGHYAREQERCAEEVLQANKRLHCHFEDREPLVEGSVDERFHRMFAAIVDGDKVTSYRLFLGLAAQPELRDRLRNETLFAAIIDQQEFNSFRKVRHIGHKAIRTRSMLDIADWVGWDDAHPFFYVGVPDLCNAPIFHSLYDHASFMLGITFKGRQYRLHETNTAPLTEAEQDELIARILAGDPVAVTHAITALLQEGRALTAIADMVMIAHATHCVERLRTPIAYTVPMHAFDYANVVNFWLRNFLHPHQAKAVYLSAWFVTDTIREVDWYPDGPAVEKPDYAPPRGWADRLAAGAVLAELERTIAAQDPSRSVALVRSYLERGPERDPLIRTLVHCAAKFQGDAHIFRNARSIIEEYYLNSARVRRKDVLLQAWAHYLSFYKKRTLSTDCYDLYHERFGPQPA
jgi:DNA-binding GntR family transcriptional regulator